MVVSESVAVSVATTVPTAEPSSNEAVDDELPDESKAVGVPFEIIALKLLDTSSAVNTLLYNLTIGKNPSKAWLASKPPPGESCSCPM